MTVKRNSLHYEIRVTCFIDILGFHKIVSDTVGPGGKVIEENVQRLVDAFTFLRQCLDLDEPDDGGGSTRITQFSDSVVISFRYSEESGVFWTLLKILHLLMGLIPYGLLCRGGISLGRLIHTDRYLFGPALVDAYSLESRAANHPRVILDDSIIAISEAHRAAHHSAQHEKQYVTDLIKKDSDGMYFVDYFESVYSELDEPELDYPRYLSDLSLIIAKGLKAPDPSVRVKYHWVRERYNAALQKCKTACQSGKIRDPEIVDAYELLDYL